MGDSVKCQHSATLFHTKNSQGWGNSENFNSLFKKIIDYATVHRTTAFWIEAQYDRTNQKHRIPCISIRENWSYKKTPLSTNLCHWALSTWLSNALRSSHLPSVSDTPAHNPPASKTSTIPRSDRRIPLKNKISHRVKVYLYQQGWVVSWISRKVRKIIAGRGSY